MRDLFEFLIWFWLGVASIISAVNLINNSKQEVIIQEIKQSIAVNRAFDECKLELDQGNKCVILPIQSVD